MIEGPESFTCHYVYVNSTSKVQMIRVANVPDWHFERIAFPGQRLLIEAKPEAVVEIYTKEKTQPIFQECLSSDDLQCVWL